MTADPDDFSTDFSLRMHQGEALETMYADVAKTVMHILNSHSGALTYWEKLWASQALAGMQSSLAAAKASPPASTLGSAQARASHYDAPFDSGQHIAMLSLEALHTPLEGRDVSQYTVNADIDAMTKDVLLRELSALTVPKSVKKHVIKLRSI